MCSLWQHIYIVSETTGGGNGDLGIFQNYNQFNKFMLSSGHVPVLIVAVNREQKKGIVHVLQELDNL